MCIPLTVYLAAPCLWGSYLSEMLVWEVSYESPDSWMMFFQHLMRRKALVETIETSTVFRLITEVGMVPGDINSAVT